MIQWVVKNGDLIIETIKSIAKVLAVLWAVKKAAAFANVINGVITAIKGHGNSHGSCYNSNNSHERCNGDPGIPCQSRRCNCTWNHGSHRRDSVPDQHLQRGKDTDRCADGSTEGIHEASHNMKAAI